MGTFTRFVTFYSYKGGVGRTSALINAAMLRALAGDQVVVIDFDLEAPGVASYLRKLSPDFPANSPGVLEYFSDATSNGVTPSLSKNAVNLTPALKSKNGGVLWAINAGNTSDPDYSRRLEQLKWSEIFEKNYGELLLKNFKNQIISEFNKPDYVFIDSRTGITETGGVCTRYLADTLVILTSLNEQNISGTSLIYKDLVTDTKEAILVASNVPVGMPPGADQLFHTRIRDFESAFKKSPDIFIYYYPSLSLDETLPTLMSPAVEADHDEERRLGLYKSDPLYQSYSQLSREIDNRNKNSYQELLWQAGWQMRVRFMDPGYDASAFRNLREYYADRLLSRLLIELDDMIGKLADPNFFETAEFGQQYGGWRKRAKATSSQKITTAVDVANEIFSTSLRKYLATGAPMSSFLEAFEHPERIGELVLQEISKGNCTWASSFLERHLAENAYRDDFDRMRDQYNLATCLLRLGNVEKALKFFGSFLEAFSSYDISPYKAANRANFLFCAGMASKELKKKEEAKEFFRRCNEELSQLKHDSTVFSPIHYKEVSVAEMRDQLGEEISKLK